jgi:zinc transporter ZupT
MLPKVSVADTYLFVLIGFGCFYFIEQYIMLHSCPEPDCEFHEIGKLAFLGISFHTFIDGIAMGAGFALSEQLGVLITLAILVHKAPTGFSLSSIMINGGYKRGEIIRFLIIFSLMVPIGAILSNYVLSGVQSIVVESAIAFSAGTFLYIGIGDLLPEAHKTRRMSIVVAVLIGMFAGSASTLIGI